MAQGYCLLASIPQPFILVRGGSDTASVVLGAPAIVVWSDGSSDTYAAPLPISPAASYGGTTFDSTALLWNIVAVKGVGIKLVKQKDAATWDTVLGGTPTWAVLAEVEGAVLRRVPQPPAARTPGTAAGDTEYWSGTAWVILPIP